MPRDCGTQSIVEPKQMSDRETMSDQADQSNAPQESTGDSDHKSGAAVLDKPAHKKSPGRVKPRLLPPYKVLLHNDDVNDMEHVIVSLLKVTPLNMDDAIQKMVEAHDSGISLLLVTHQELAELYQEQLTSLSLTVTIEPDA